MQLARLLIYWHPRRWVSIALCGALGLWAGQVAAQQSSPAPAVPDSLPPPPQVAQAPGAVFLPPPPAVVAPQPGSGPAREPWRGAPYFAVSLGPALASFTSRLLLGGSLAIAGGPMLTPTLGLVLQGRAEIGSLDARYLMVSSGRVGVGIMGRLNERTTLTGTWLLASSATRATPRGKLPSRPLLDRKSGSRSTSLARPPARQRTQRTIDCGTTCSCQSG